MYVIVNFSTKIELYREFETAGAVCSIEESSGLQNPKVSTVLKASKSGGAKGDVPKIYRFVHQGVCSVCIL